MKIRGQRIELGEIEAALRELSGVTDAAAAVHEFFPGDKRIVGYLVAKDSIAKDRAQLQQALKKRLPAYMVPAAFVELTALPLSSSGKLDRRALPAPPPDDTESGDYRAPAAGTETVIAQAWAQVLGRKGIGADDNFFDLGGHSLVATQVVAKVRAATGVALSVMDLFTSPTIRELATLVDRPADTHRPRPLLYELTAPVPAGQRVLSYVCIPYGGGTAAIFQPLAQALPAGHRLFAVAAPGDEVGLAEESIPLDELATKCVNEILVRVDGPIALYAHCAGAALAVQIARRLETAGRTVTAIYFGAVFPFAKPGKRVWSGLSTLAGMKRLRADQAFANWLAVIGDLDPASARQVVRIARRAAVRAEEFFTDLLREPKDRLRTPIISVVGEHDPDTEFAAERYREWHFLTDTTALATLDEAGHFFVTYRAKELADIVTTAHHQLADEEPGPVGDENWRIAGVFPVRRRQVIIGPQPSMRRFLTVASGQLVSIVGSALTEFALPMWIYLKTGSLLSFALLAVAGLLPGMVVAPLAGALVDRYDRRLIMLLGDCAAGGTQLALGILFFSGHLQLWQIYPLVGLLSVALSFQRLAYGSAVAQLAPKHYLGHANGVVQMIGGASQVLVPLVAVGLLASIGLGGILIFDVASYVFAIAVVSLVRFPTTLARHRKEPLLAETVNGFRFSWGQRGFRAMLLFFMVLNIFLAPMFMLVSPTVLSFASLADAGRVALAGGVGVLLGGLVMAFWGGPRHQRLRGVFLCALACGAACVITGLRANLWVLAAGALLMSLCVTLLNSLYATIVHVKVPATIPRPGFRGEHPDRVVHASAGMGDYRTVRDPSPAAADESRRRAGHQCRRGHRHRTGPGRRSRLLAVRRGNHHPGAGVHAHSVAEEFRHGCTKRCHG
ncbi:MFS transporter [Fodinicola feengrottensis]|uniref:MFS transporter n=1 Tax=Fodinicola feengrottensis TaxID=435914 RepID=UPI002441940C|nr:MFS transporter [Fodinicola feengrottensis]